MAAAAAAAAAGLSWDHNLVPPTTPGRPPAPASVLPWNGLPPSGPNAHLAPFCDDRVHHHPAPGGGPGAIPAGADPCSSAVVGTENPLPVPAHVLHPAGWNCQACPLPPAAGTRRVCWHCYLHIRNQPWWWDIGADVRNPPPPAPVAQPIATWTGFQTLLCRDCEHREIIILHDTVRQHKGGIPPPPWWLDVLGRTPPWPCTTCTCLSTLVLNRLCIQHNHTRACTGHDRLLETRQQNDNWLRNIKRIDGKRLVKADAKTRARRVRTGVFRACRCGAEVTRQPGVPARVYMCMACEGIIHVGPYTHPYVHSCFGGAAALIPAQPVSRPLPTRVTDMTLRRK